MTEAVLGLGANLGEPVQAITDALDALTDKHGVAVTAVAGLWQSSPVGGPEQPDFHNTVALVDSSLTVSELLAVVQDLEARAGRVRTVRWGPRTLDVDILAFDEVRSADPALTLPHPRAHVRAFVLVPWAQLQPGRALTPDGQAARTVAEWALRCSDQDLREIAPPGWWRP